MSAVECKGRCIQKDIWNKSLQKSTSSKNPIVKSTCYHNAKFINAFGSLLIERHTTEFHLVRFNLTKLNDVEVV
jgi:hypothetical protein